MEHSQKYYIIGPTPILSRPLSDPFRPLSPHAADRPRVNVARGKHAEPQLLRQPARVGVVVGVLDPLVRRHLRRIAQPDVPALRLQPIHQPIPVEGGLHAHRFDPGPIEFQRLVDGFQVRLHPPPIHFFPAAIDDGQKNVVPMQVGACIQCLRFGRLHLCSFRCGRPKEHSAFDRSLFQRASIWLSVL